MTPPASRASSASPTRRSGSGRRRSSVGGAGVSGRASGRAVSDGADGSESPTRFVAITVKLYSTLFVSPSSVHVVAGALLRVVAAGRRHGVARDRGAVVGRRRPRQHDGAVLHARHGRRARCVGPALHRERRCGPRPRGRRRRSRPGCGSARPSCRRTSRRGSPRRASPTTSAKPLPVSVTAATTFSGSSGNGLKSLSSTGTRHGLALVRLGDDVVVGRRQRAGGCRHRDDDGALDGFGRRRRRSARVSVACVPFGVSGVGADLQRLRRRSTRSGRRALRRRSSSACRAGRRGRGRSVSAARSRLVGSSPGATSIWPSTKVGCWLSGGSTVTGSVSVAFSPSGSSGPVPSVTSNVIASCPK